jgi:hypothetical protein
VRRLKLAIGAILLLGIPVTLAAAQAPVPTVAVTANGSSITLTPSGTLAAGPTRFNFTGKGEFVLATLRAGVTADQLRQALSRSPDAALALVFLEASAPEPGREVTVDLRPSTTYVAVSLAGRNSSLTTFATGAPSGAQARAPDARIRMVDYGFKGPNTLPRNGRIRVANQGSTFHFAVAFPVRPSASNKRVGRALRSGNDKAMGRIVAGPPLTVQGLISQGSTNDNVVRFPRKGRYAMVCFFGEHNRLGMYRVYKVR